MKAAITGTVTSKQSRTATVRDGSVQVITTLLVMPDALGSVPKHLLCGFTVVVPPDFYEGIAIEDRVTITVERE